MFLPNKYTKWYFSIIENAKHREVSGYIERHHIIPRSLGGSNSKNNLISLSAKEHFVCHVLLTKMLDEHTSEYKKMLHAIMLFKGMNNEQPRYINSRLYESLKKDYAIIRSKARKGVSLSEEHKLKISSSMKGHKVSDEAKLIISEKAKTRKRKPFSDEYKKRLSEIMKERHRWKNATVADVVIAAG